MHFGPYPDKRELPPFVKKLETEDLALKMLRQRNALDAEHKKELADAQKKADRLAEKLAILVHKKRFTENDPFVMSLRQLLKNEGILLVTHVGEEVTESLEDEADIVEWLPPSEDQTDRVVDALEPEVYWEGRLLHRAKLSCRQGAEEAEEESQKIELPAPDPAADVLTEKLAEAEPEKEELPAPDPAADVLTEKLAEAEPEKEELPAPDPAADVLTEKLAEAEPEKEELPAPDPAADVLTEKLAEAEPEKEELPAPDSAADVLTEKQAEVEEAAETVPEETEPAAEVFSEEAPAEAETAAIVTSQAEYYEAEEEAEVFSEVTAADPETEDFTEVLSAEPENGYLEEETEEDGFFARFISGIRAWFSGEP